MRTIWKLAAVLAAAALLKPRPGGGNGPGTTDVDPAATRTRVTSGPDITVNGITSANAANKATLAQGQAGGGTVDNMGHELGPGGVPIYRTPDGFKSTDDIDTEGAADFLPNGSAVFHGDTYTRIGSDEQTVNNVNNIAPMEGTHDIVVHGEPDGLVSVDGNAVNPQQIVTALQNNPNYDGGPIRLLVCHSGSSGVAQEISNATGAPVYAPSDRVGTIRELGPGQEPIVDNNGTFDWFYPEN